MSRAPHFVIPAKAGIQNPALFYGRHRNWTPAFAGVTKG